MTSDNDRPVGPIEHKGRYKRLWMELEVEVVDELALRTFDLHTAGDADGNTTGLVDMGVNKRVGFALSSIAAQAWRAAEAQTGIHWMGGSGPSVRYLDEDGNFAEFTMPAMPARRDDGSYDDKAFPPRA